MHTLQAAPGCSPSSSYLDIVSCVTCLLGIFPLEHHFPYNVDGAEQQLSDSLNSAYVVVESHLRILIASTISYKCLTNVLQMVYKWFFLACTYHVRLIDFQINRK